MCGDREGNLRMLSLDKLRTSMTVGTSLGSLEVASATPHSDAITAIDCATFPTRTSFLTASLDNTLKALDMETLKTTGHYVSPHEKYIRGISISPYHRLIATCGRDTFGALHMLDNAAAPPVKLIDHAHPHSNPLIGIHCVQNTHQILTADSGGLIKVWDARQNACVNSFHTPRPTHLPMEQRGRQLSSMIYCESKRRLLTVGKTTAIFKYDLRQSELTAHAEPLVALVYNTITQTILTATTKQVKVWNVQNGSAVASFGGIVPANVDITCLSFDTLQGRRFFIGTSEGYIAAFLAITGRELWRHTVEENVPVQFVSLYSKRAYLIGMASGEIIRWLDDSAYPQSVVHRIDDGTLSHSCFNFNIGLMIYCSAVTHGLYIYDCWGRGFTHCNAGSYGPQGPISALAFIKEKTYEAPQPAAAVLTSPAEDVLTPTNKSLSRHQSSNTGPSGGVKAGGQSTNASRGSVSFDDNMTSPPLERQNTFAVMAGKVKSNARLLRSKGSITVEKAGSSPQQQPMLDLGGSFSKQPSLPTATVESPVTPASPSGHQSNFSPASSTKGKKSKLSLADGPSVYSSSGPSVVCLALFAVADTFGAVHLWVVDPRKVNGEATQCIKSLRSPKSAMTLGITSTSGRYLVAGTDRNFFTVWDLKGVIKSLEKGQAELNAPILGIGPIVQSTNRRVTRLRSFGSEIGLSSPQQTTTTGGGGGGGGVSPVAAAVDLTRSSGSSWNAPIIDFGRSSEAEAAGGDDAYDPYSFYDEIRDMKPFRVVFPTNNQDLCAFLSAIPGAAAFVAGTLEGDPTIKLYTTDGNCAGYICQGRGSDDYFSPKALEEEEGPVSTATPHRPTRIDSPLLTEEGARTPTPPPPPTATAIPEIGGLNGGTKNRLGSPTTANTTTTGVSHRVKEPESADIEPFNFDIVVFHDDDESALLDSTSKRSPTMASLPVKKKSVLSAAANAFRRGGSRGNLQDYEAPDGREYSDEEGVDLNRLAGEPPSQQEVMRKRRKHRRHQLKHIPKQMIVCPEHEKHVPALIHELVAMEEKAKRRQEHPMLKQAMLAQSSVAFKRRRSSTSPTLVQQQLSASSQQQEEEALPTSTAKDRRWAKLHLGASALGVMLQAAKEREKERDEELAKRTKKIDLNTRRRRRHQTAAVTVSGLGESTLGMSVQVLGGSEEDPLGATLSPSVSVGMLSPATTTSSGGYYHDEEDGDTTASPSSLGTGQQYSSMTNLGVAVKTGGNRRTGEQQMAIPHQIAPIWSDHDDSGGVGDPSKRYIPPQALPHHDRRHSSSSLLSPPTSGTTTHRRFTAFRADTSSQLVAISNELTTTPTAGTSSSPVGAPKAPSVISRSSGGRTSTAAATTAGGGDDLGTDADHTSPSSSRLPDIHGSGSVQLTGAGSETMRVLMAPTLGMAAEARTSHTMAEVSLRGVVRAKKDNEVDLRRKQLQEKRRLQEANSRAPPLPKVKTKTRRQPTRAQHQVGTTGGTTKMLRDEEDPYGGGGYEGDHDDSISRFDVYCAANVYAKSPFQQGGGGGDTSAGLVGIPLPPHIASQLKGRSVTRSDASPGGGGGGVPTSSSGIGGYTPVTTAEDELEAIHNLLHISKPSRCSTTTAHPPPPSSSPASARVHQPQPPTASRPSPNTARR